MKSVSPSSKSITLSIGNRSESQQEMHVDRIFLGGQPRGPTKWMPPIWRYDVDMRLPSSGKPWSYLVREAGGDLDLLAFAGGGSAEF